MTNYWIIDALVEANNRGIEIKIIVDTYHALQAYSKHEQLRKAGIKVKVENWAGKMHMKSIIIDESTLVIGSMNFTKQGENINDENCLIIKNAPELTTKYKKHFLELWNSIK